MADTGSDRSLRVRWTRAYIGQPGGVSMGVVYDQFAQELERWQRKYAGRPRDELIGLCLRALEREELVTVGYREDLTAERTCA
jgi:hypothetical protein